MFGKNLFSEDSLGQCDPAVEFGDRIGWNINLLSRDEEYKNVPKTRGDSVEYVSCQINDQLTPYCLGLTLRVPFWQRDVGLQERLKSSSITQSKNIWLTPRKWSFYDFCSPMVSMTLQYVDFVDK